MMEMTQKLWMLRNINAVIMESRQLWPVFAAVEHVCVTHSIPLGLRLISSFLSQTGHILMPLRQCMKFRAFFFFSRTYSFNMQ